MEILSTEFRRQLGRTVIVARDVAEAGARGALEALAVHHHEPYGYMSGEQRRLRNRLRAHARHRGDRVDAGTGSHTIDHLVQECAYEHWQGMLFARFLAENHLLIEAEMGVAITLDECEELAKEEAVDKWALAARFAHRMLPQVFRPDHPVFGVQFAREYRLKLEGLVEALPVEVFTATDALGWVYQFWQTKKKDEVNRSEVKIGADELAAVTQLFTEPYMVQFLLHNSVGAWWVSCHSGKDCPVDLTYLRRTEDGASAAGTFEGWPDDLSDFRLLDPCCGSGHFLVAAFLMLVPMRIALEGLDAAEAVDAVLRENIHGLELDQRCVAIAAFALALEAWRHPDAGGFRTLPKLNLAWCGQPVAGKKEHWLALGEGDFRLEAGMAALHDNFRDAPTLGSLIDPARFHQQDILVADFKEVQPKLAEALRKFTGDDNWEETSIAAKGLAAAAELLLRNFHLIVTNPPFLGAKKQSKRLRSWLADNFGSGKADLAAAFLLRMRGQLVDGGYLATVTPHEWLFLKSYTEMRRLLLQTMRFGVVARLGYGSFDTPIRTAPVLSLIENSTPTKSTVSLELDAHDAAGPHAKSIALKSSAPIALEQLEQLNNPDCRLGPPSEGTQTLLESAATASFGIGTGDGVNYYRQFWEIPYVTEDWELLRTTVPEGTAWSGSSQIVLWEQGRGSLAKMAKSMKHLNYAIQNWRRGQEVWVRQGVAVNGMGPLHVTLYNGEKFDNNVAAIVPNSIGDLSGLWAYCCSGEFAQDVRRLDQKTNITGSKTFLKVGFDRDRWAAVSKVQFPRGLPRPYSDDPTQWFFHGHPNGSVVWDVHSKTTAEGQRRKDSNVLLISVARLLGYRWPAEINNDMELAEEQRAWATQAEELGAFADEDGIVCIPSVRGERPAAERVLQLLQTANGDGWHDGILTNLLAESGSASLDDWLRNQFFEEHCKLFHHRPFIWHIWDGRKGDGFHALVNYHKLAETDGEGRRLLESLTYSYLGDWINRQRDGVKRGEGGAEDRLAAALELKKRLVSILEGEPPFDLFVRWKCIEGQPIGWEPDINDGVRLNIRPFMAQDLPGGKKGAGILRAKPNIHWKKDRGKEPVRELAQYPWFWKNGKFTGERMNDVHLTLAEKQAACDRAGEKT